MKSEVVYELRKVAYELRKMNISQAFNALKDAVLDRQFESMPRLSLAYREAMVDAVQGPDFWKLWHETVSLVSIIKIIGTEEYITSSKASELALVIESFPIDLSLAYRFMQNDDCPRDLLVNKLILTEPVLDFVSNRRLRSFLLALANADAISADKLLLHILCTQKADSHQLKMRENIDYLFATIETIGHPSRQLSRELASLDRVMSDSLKSLVSECAEDPVSYKTIAILYSCGCKETCRTVLQKGILNFYRNSLMDSATGWKAVAEAGVPMPGNFVRSQCIQADINIKNSSDGESMGFIFYQYLAGRRLDLESSLIIQNSKNQTTNIFNGLSASYEAAEVNGLSIEDRLLPLLNYLSDSIKDKKLFYTLALSSSIPGKIFASISSMKNNIGNLFTKDLGL